MKKMVLGVVFASGLLAGLLASPLFERHASAQGDWQCMSWRINGGDNNLEPVSRFLAGANRVELTSTAYDPLRSRFALVACKQ